MEKITLWHFYIALLCICMAVLLIRFRLLPRYCRWFLPLIGLALITEYLKEEPLKAYKNIITHLYQPLECLLLFAFYNDLLKSRKNKQFLVYSYIFFLIAVISYYWFYIGTINVSDNYMDFVLQALLICVLVVLFLKEMLNHQGELNLFGYSPFWLNAIHLIFFGGCFFSMGTYEAIRSSNNEWADLLQKIPHYLNLLLYSVYIIIFSTARKEKV